MRTDYDVFETSDKLLFGEQLNNGVFVIDSETTKVL